MNENRNVGLIITEQLRLKRQTIVEEQIKNLRSQISHYDKELSKFVSNTDFLNDQTFSIVDYWEKLCPGFAVANGVIRYCKATNRTDVRFIHDGLFYSLFDPYFNNIEFATQFDNKAYYPLLFHDINQPETFAIRINGLWLDSNYCKITFQSALERCSQVGGIVIKYARGSAGGMGVSFMKNPAIDDLSKIFNSSQLDLVIQAEFKQNSVLSKLHSASVNTLRFITLLWKGNVQVLSSVVRMGINGSRVDNASAGGITCGIEDDGRLKSVAYDKYGNQFTSHPQGPVFSGIIIPSFAEAKQLALNLQMRFPYCKMISWDIAISENREPTLIEANFTQGQLEFHQFNNGPIFGELTKEVIEHVFANFMKK